MRIVTNKIDSLLDDRLSLFDRGLFISIVLLRDKDESLTLAKVKAKVNMKEAKESLIKLHELDFIKWSGYNLAKKSIEEKQLEPEVIDVIDFLNNLYKTTYKYTSASHYTSLLNRLKDNSVDDIKRVIANRYSVWKDDKVMHVHLNPSTIFRPSKFAKYLEETNMSHKGERFLNAVKIGLNEGDEINLKNCDTLLNDEAYYIEISYLNIENMVFNKELIYKFGKDIKRSLKVQEKTIEFGGWKEFIYKYKKE